MRWPQLKKAACEGREIVFVDETALYLLPVVTRSYAPCGQTSLLEAPLSRGRVHLERLPGYAPEQNPVEGVWKHLKLVELKNLRCPDLGELKQAYGRARMRLWHKTGTIAACSAMAGLV